MKALKAEIRSLESTFPRSHPRLQIISASVDELTCRFIDPSGRKHTIHANITVGFWFYKCDLDFFLTLMNSDRFNLGLYEFLQPTFVWSSLEQKK